MSEPTTHEGRLRFDASTTMVEKAEAEPGVPGEASLLRDDWAFAEAAADSLPPTLAERVRPVHLARTLR